MGKDTDLHELHSEGQVRSIARLVKVVKAGRVGVERDLNATDGSGVMLVDSDCDDVVRLISRTRRRTHKDRRQAGTVDVCLR